MPADPAPFYAGLHCHILFIVDNAKVDASVQKWSIKPDVTKANDGINGETRDRLARYTNYFTLNFNILQTDTKLLEAMLKDIDNEDAAGFPLEKSLGIIITPPNGRKRAFEAFGQICIDDWEWASAGRTERAPFTLPMRSQQFKERSTFG